MTTSNDITLDHISDFFSLNKSVEQISLAPTATGGVGINNIEMYPPPQPTVSVVKPKDTNYVKKYLEKARLEDEKKRSVNVVTGSTYSINGMEDVEDLSTAMGDIPEINELDDGTTQQIYATYYSNDQRTCNEELNISNYREEIIQQLNINPVLIIQGPTGCGKTTQVPQYILDYHAMKGKHCNIIVTQPRKIAAISIAKRVCHERNWALGTLVGYQVAMDPKVSADTRLCYVTTGVLLEKLVAQKNMNKYTHVIIDEVHERDQDIDFALLLVKKFLMSNSQRVKVILMSATFDTSIFAKYFSLSMRGDLAPIIEVSGKRKEVTEHYLHELKVILPQIPHFDLNEPMIDPCLFDVVVKLITLFDGIEKKEQNVPPEQDFAPSRGAVLIFLPGYEEITALTNKLNNTRFSKKYWIIPLHSVITLNEQAKVFSNPPPENRKIIISTNIAESSITVPDVKYVIDFCLTKSLVTDPLTNYTCLQLEWAPKANCIQRKGRAGRVSIGKVYRMVPKQFYEQFPDYGIPEIKRCPLTSTILHLKKLNVCEPEEMLAFALDPPYLVDIENAILQLKEGLALYGKGSHQEGGLTFVGNVMASLPLDIKLSKLILFGYAFSCLEDCIIIAACLSLQSFFARPFQKTLESYRSRLSWADYSFSDCFAYLNAYKMWKQHSMQSFFQKPGGMKEKEWGEKFYIQIRRIKEVDMLVNDIKSRLERHNIYVDSHHQNVTKTDNPTSDLILKLVLAGAFFPHYFLQSKLDELEALREVNENDPLTTVVVSGLPPNQGLLYALALRDMFSCCSDKIDIEFEERKAYIKFERHEISSRVEEYKLPSGSVLPSVYLAVKMRLLRMPLELDVFSHEEAESKVQQIIQMKRESSTKALPSNRFSVKMNPVSTLERIPLPNPDVIIVPLFITHAHNCGHFWARYMTPESSKHLRFLDYTIHNYLKEKNLKPLDKPPHINLLCLAPYVEDKSAPVEYYRAQVQSIKDRFVKVHFVDYGNDEEVLISDLREISDDLPDVRKTPALAFECFLSGIKPSSSHHHLGVWSSTANAWFKKTVNGVELKGKVYSVVQDTIRLELLKANSDGSIDSINELLIKMGYAEPAEESLPSKINHEHREKCTEYFTNKNNMVIDHSSSSMELSLEDVVQFNTDRQKNHRIRLRGPHNPLEVSYTGMANIDRCKCIKVERDSVNSVSFRPDPQDQHSSMLVASHLTIGQKTDVIVARNTTLMPRIPGLPSLICLMFAPFTEIRTEKEKKTYTGALCGLGYDKLTGEALYPDHDIEIEFDTEITLEHIKTVNSIRMGLNLILKAQDQRICMEYKRTLREYIIDFLKEKHNPREPYMNSKCGQWNQIPDYMLLKPEVPHAADDPFVLPLLRPPFLKIGPEQ